MANPQKENGHIDIANEIAEHLAYYRLSGQEYQILWVIWRKTWGWHKKEDWIALSQFFALTKIKKPSIIKTIKKLVGKKIVSKKANREGVSYRFNKDFDTWKPLAKRLIVSNMANGVSKKANKSLAKRLPTKENYTKETITKEKAGKPAEPEINHLMGLFRSINPTINFGNTTQREVLKNLLSKFGLEKLMNTIKYAISIQGERYAPTITTPYQLKENMGKLLVYYKKEASKKTLIV